MNPNQLSIKQTMQLEAADVKCSTTSSKIVFDWIDLGLRVRLHEPYSYLIDFLRVREQLHIQWSNRILNSMHYRPLRCSRSIINILQITWHSIISIKYPLWLIHVQLLHTAKLLEYADGTMMSNLIKQDQYQYCKQENALVSWCEEVALEAVDSLIVVLDLPHFLGETPGGITS